MSQVKTGVLYRLFFFTHPSFQVPFLAPFLVIGGGVLATIYMVQSYFFDMYRQHGKTLGYPADHLLFAFIEEQQRVMDFSFAMAAGFAFLLMAYLGLAASHRVAGPLYRFEQELRQVADSGQVRRLKFRKHDSFQSLAEAFNRAMERLGAAPQAPKEPDPPPPTP